MPFTCFDFQSGTFVPCGLGPSYPWNYTGVPVAQWLVQTFPQLPVEAAQQCQQQGQSLWAKTGDRQTPPKVLISPVAPQNTPYPIMLACMAWGFYPGDVNLTWLWNGQPVRDHLDPVQVTSNGDWTFQARLTLPVDPEKGGSYTCAVQHHSLPAPLTAEWAPGLPTELCIKIGVSVAAMAVGTAFLVAGLLLWKRSRHQGESPPLGSEGEGAP
ncbi:HLA class II histocompatibility antigen, DM beta chain, partial [Notechis scutatus]|uniref:HLA class II histocompatibility antigen, DM beta chain n=1 Tax=Notechis scutatus TaxID=8663 RepID=A0A6J1W4F4_9SAUR